MKVSSFALWLCVSSSMAASETEDARNALDKMLEKSNGAWVNDASKAIWHLEIIQRKQSLDQVLELWKKAKSDEERRSIASTLMSDDCNIWSIDSSEGGEVRKYIVGGKERQDELVEIQDWHRAHVGARLRPATGDLPMDRESAHNRLKKDFHMGKSLDILMADIRASGYLTMANPGFDNLKDIPEDVLPTMPNATDRQKLTTSTVELHMDEAQRTDIIVSNTVIKIIKESK